MAKALGTGGAKPPPVARVSADAPPHGSVAPPASASASPAGLPPGIEPGVLTTLEVPGDRPLYVIHAPADQRQAMIYLHGVCGDATAPSSWAAAAARHGTLLSLLGDSPCESRPGRFSWKDPTFRVAARVARALDAVKQARGGLLDTQKLAAMGYSQGAARAENLIGDYPDLFRYALLAGTPIEPRVEKLRRALAVAVVGGEREDTSFMEAGVVALRKIGVPARFWRLEDAKHGEYGPQGEQIMGEALGWLFTPRPPPAPR